LPALRLLDAQVRDGRQEEVRDGTRVPASSTPSFAPVITAKIAAAMMSDVSTTIA
jgi:hypothetical protein